MSVDNASLSCDNDLQTFRQHSGECWNDAIQNFLLVASGLGEIVRQQLRPADAVATFSAWLTSEEIQLWLQTNYGLPPDLLLIFNRLAVAYIECFKQRIDNWRDKRIVGNSARHRRASCVFSKCSASAGQYISELLWPPDALPPGKRLLITKNNIRKLRNGTIDPLKNARENKESPGIQIGYNALWLAPFIRILLYYFLKEDTYITVNQLAGVYLRNMVNKSYMISEPQLKMNEIATIYRTMKKSHSMNIIVSGYSPLKEGYHQIHLVSCDTSSRNQYIYDNNVNYLQKVRWAKVFDEEAKSQYIKWTDEIYDKYTLERTLAHLFSAQAYVTSGRSTNEQMHKEFSNTFPLNALLIGVNERLKYFTNVIKDIDFNKDKEEKERFFEAIEIDITIPMRALRYSLLKLIRYYYDDSILLKMFVDFKTILILLIEDKYYFYNSTGYRVLTDKELGQDVITVAGTLFCEGDIQKFLLVMSSGFTNISGNYTIYNCDLVWMVPTKVKNVSFNKTMRANNNKNKTRRRS